MKDLTKIHYYFLLLIIQISSISLLILGIISVYHEFNKIIFLFPDNFLIIITIILVLSSIYTLIYLVKITFFHKLPSQSNSEAEQNEYDFYMYYIVITISLIMNIFLFLQL